MANNILRFFGECLIKNQLSTEFLLKILCVKVTKLSCIFFAVVSEFYQNRGWTIDINLSIATDTVAQIDPFKDICRIGRSQGNING